MQTNNLLFIQYTYIAVYNLFKELSPLEGFLCQYYW